MCPEMHHPSQLQVPDSVAHPPSAWILLPCCMILAHSEPTGENMKLTMVLGGLFLSLALGSCNTSQEHGTGGFFTCNCRQTCHDPEDPLATMCAVYWADTESDLNSLQSQCNPPFVMTEGSNECAGWFAYCCNHKNEEQGLESWTYSNDPAAVFACNEPGIPNPGRNECSEAPGQ
jgi:hypothetical protein